MTGFDGIGSLVRRRSDRATKPSARRARKLRYRWVSVALWAGLVLLWEVGARSGAMPPYVVAPSIIALTVVQLAADGELWTHVSASSSRAVGLAIGATSLAPSSAFLPASTDPSSAISIR